MDSKYRIELADNSKGSANMNSFNNSSETVIKVIGVGNGGCNAVNRMIDEGLNGVEFIAMNTDKQALSRSKAPIQIVLGERITQGLGAGTDPEKGAEAAREDIARIEEIVNGANLVFVASSFGGGTGTGASPVVAETAKKAGALTIGVITKPFEYEGKLKMDRAESGIEKMLSVVDSIIIIPNENLYNMVDLENYTFEESLSVVDDILRQGVQGISDIITYTGFVNVDFADVRTMISLSNGRAHLGIGIGKGDDRLQKSIKNAFENPLLDVSSIKNAKGILANIVCPEDFRMKEYREASKIIRDYANENANIKIGVCNKEELKDEIIVTIVATGFDYKGDKENNETKDDKKEENDDHRAININDNLINENIDFKSFNEDKAEKLEKPFAINEIKIKKEDDNREEKREEDIKRNFKNNIEAIKKPIISQSAIKKSIIEDYDENGNVKEEAENNYISKDSYKVEVDSSDSRNEEVNDSSEDNLETSKNSEKYPWDIISKKDMKLHEDLGAKSYFGADTSQNDIEDTPAFLRRSIVARNVKK